MRARAAVIAVLALGLSGCGTAGSERDVKASVGRFFAALDRHDGQAACNELSEEAASALEQDEKKPCAQAVLSLGITKAPIRRVQVFVEAAQARLEGGGAVFLDETPEGWRISAAGCKPQRNMPYDCELEA